LLSGYSAQRRDVADVILNSVEYRVRFITGAYQKLLGRSPGDAEVAFWLGARQRGATEEDVLAAILGSPEYFQLAGGTNDLWLSRVYQTLLGRGRDSSSQIFLVSLNNGTASRQQVAATIMGSSEFRQRLVFGYYQSYLGRTPASSEVGFWVSALQNGARNED